LARSASGGGANYEEAREAESSADLHKVSMLAARRFEGPREL
jgi:hypothetical protein